MFNTREYEFSDVTVVLGGKDITGLLAFEYGVKQAKTYSYGKGSDPRTIQKGNKEPSASLTLLQSEFNTIVANSPNEDILSIEFDIIFSYGNPSQGDMLITKKALGCQVTEWKEGMKQGDAKMEVVLPIMFLRVEKV